MNDEARRLLAEVPHAYKCSTYDYDEDAEGSAVDYRRCDCHRVAIDVFLAQPEPAAREAAAVRDIEQLRDIAHEWFEEGRLTKEGLDAFCAIGPTYEQCSTCKGNGRVEMLEHCPDCRGDGINPIPADTSPAAAALLVQGERQKRFIQAVEQDDWLALIDIAGLANAGEDGLLVNYKVAGDYEVDARSVWPKRLALLGKAARAALAPGEEKE